MGRIYSAADEVFAYLGPEPARLNADISILSSSMDRWSRWVIGKEQQHFGRILEVDEALLDILTRPYWTRLWVVQELQLAKKVVFWCGPITMAHEFLVDYSEELRHRGIAQVDPRLHSKYTLFMQDYQMLVNAMLCHKMAWLPPESQVGLLSLDEVLRKYANCSCSDTRDKIFGLQELVRREDRIDVDYSLPLEELAKRVRNAICRSIVRTEVPRFPRLGEPGMELGERVEPLISDYLKSSDYMVHHRFKDLHVCIAKIPIVDLHTTKLSYKQVAIISWAYYIVWLFEHSQLSRWARDHVLRERWWRYAIYGWTTQRQRLFIEDLDSRIQRDKLEEVTRLLLEQVAAKHGFVFHNDFLLHPSEWDVLGEDLCDDSSSREYNAVACGRPNSC
jgi:hypothetical protein